MFAMKKTFGNLSANFLSRTEMKSIKGGNEMLDSGGEGCVDTCSSTCPCSDSRDWCDGGKCKTRPN